MREIIVRIVKTLAGINYDDLTTAERKIADMLIAYNYMVKDNTGELTSTD